MPYKSALGKILGGWGGAWLVGDDPSVTDAMTWEELKSQDWGNQTSLVRSGKSYESLFKGKIWKGNDGGKGTAINRHKLHTFLLKHSRKSEMAKILCPWVSSAQFKKDLMD